MRAAAPAAASAAQSGLFALQASQVAAERSSRAGIRDFAQSVVE